MNVVKLRGMLCEFEMIELMYLGAVTYIARVNQLDNEIQCNCLLVAET